MELEHEADFPIAESGQIGVIQFVDLGSIDEKLATVGLVQSADDMQQSRFACARSPNDAHDFLLVDMQVDALEHFEAAVVNAAKVEKKRTSFEIVVLFLPPTFHPNPQPPHQVAPSEEKDVENPFWDGGLVSVLVDDFRVLLGGDVGIVIGTRAKVVAFDEAEFVGHNPACQKQSDYHHDDGNHFEYLMVFVHHLNISRFGTSKMTPERRNHTANSVRAMLNNWPMM